MVQSPVLKAAVGKWPGILSALGLHDLRNKHGPCPLGCGGKRSFRFDDKEGRGTWICTHCGAGNGFTLLKRWLGVTSREAMKMVQEVLPEAREAPPPRKPKIDGQKIWDESRPISPGDPAYRYLMRRVGVTSSVLRLHPGVRCEGAIYPCMVAPVVRGSQMVAIHRTFLTRDGRRADIDAPKRSMLLDESGMAGGAVRLHDAGETLGVAEGIETALAAHVLFKVPVWSVISAPMMGKLLVPDGVRRLMIFGDNDSNGTGQMAAYTLLSVAYRLKISAEVYIPETVGSDWADVLMRGGA